MAKVLIAEDDHLMRWSLEECLRRDGHTVQAVDSGSEAIEASRAGDFRVVISDYRLPGQDGVQVLRGIKTRSPQTHLILITGYGKPHLERLARDLGAFDFFDKPFKLVALKQAVDRALGTPERRRGPRCCSEGCEWWRPCERWQVLAADCA
jgi:two-component system, NtrC family, response regulator AtoC